MIADREIENKAEEFNLRPIDVEKDYVYGWLLRGVFSRPALAAQLVLKGGNALRKCYLPETRFSKDLDFSAEGEVRQLILETELAAVCKFVEEQTGVQFLDKVTVKQKNLPIPGVEALEARLYFKGFYGEEVLNLRTQLDITQFDRIYLPVQIRPLMHPYSDSTACAGSIRCHKLEEILASKLTALLHRRKAVDLFDLLYAIVIRDEYGVVRREVITTFLRKSIFEANPLAAKGQLLALPIAEFKDLWASIVAPVRSLIDFEVVQRGFAGFIESLFSLVAPPAAAAMPAPAPIGAPRVSRPGGGARFPLRAFSRTWFDADVRSTIINAGRTRTMVELTYDSYTRLVEPYKLEYYVRKKDGQGLEYFWGFDTTGGRSGKASIKQFICDKIQAARSTARPFLPRFEVEL